MVARVGEGMRDCLADVAICAENEDVGHCGFENYVMR